MRKSSFVFLVAFILTIPICHSEPLVISADCNPGQILWYPNVVFTSSTATVTLVVDSRNCIDIEEETYWKSNLYNPWPACPCSVFLQGENGFETQTWEGIEVRNGSTFPPSGPITQIGFGYTAVADEGGFSKHSATLVEE